MPERKKLIEGYKRFYKKYFIDQPKLYQDLSVSQSPKLMVIACSDSRVHPDRILDTEPGDIFVVRNVANLVPPNELDDHDTGAAMEFAIKHLGVKHVIIIGHSQCGGIRSLMEGKHDNHGYNYIDPWMNTVRQARDKVIREHPDDEFDKQCSHCEKEAISMSLDNLISFPWIRERYIAGELQTHGWYFNIRTGGLLSKGKDGFKPVTELNIPEP